MTEELQPAAWICRCSDEDCSRGKLFFDSTHPENTGWRCNSTNHFEDRVFERDDPLFTARGIEDWFQDLILTVEQAINDADIEDHMWAFKVALVELRRRDFENLQNPGEAAKEVVQILEGEE